MNNEEDFIDGKQYVVKHAKDVSISLEDVSKIEWEVMSYLNTNIQNDQLSQISKHLSRFTLEYHPDKYDSKAADWLFVLNTMNFALWNPKATKQWTVNELTGYQALCVAIKRAISVYTTIIQFLHTFVDTILLYLIYFIVTSISLHSELLLI